MKRRGAIAAIDLGSTKVTAIVAEPADRGSLRILGAGVAPAQGLARGVIDNIALARDSVSVAVQKAEQACGMRILSATVGISGSHIASQNNRGIIAVQDRSRPVTEDDRQRVLEAAANIAIPTNRQVLHVLPRGYWIEGTDPVSDPVGMYAARLDAETHIITGAVSAIQNLTKVVESAGVHVDDVVLEGLAAAEAVVDGPERLHGCAVADIGENATSLVVYEDGTVVHTAILPLAGAQMTSDLARVLRCPWENAEEVKRLYGAAHISLAQGPETIEVRAFGTQAHREVPLELVCNILQARAEEIFEVIEAELKRAGFRDRVAAGLVLTGGTSQLAGMAELAEARLDMPARVGPPRGYSGLSDIIGTPAFATAIGLVEHALHGNDRPVELHHAGLEMPAGGFLRRIAAVGRALMPH